MQSLPGDIRDVSVAICIKQHLLFIGLYHVNVITTVKAFAVVVVVLLFFVHGKHLRSCRDGQLT